MPPKKEHPVEKISLHPRNKHRERYDFSALTKTYPELKAFVFKNNYGDESINFSDASAVLALNKALLKHFYHISSWDLPKGFLCPPIPGRADYIHTVSDLLANSNHGVIPTGAQIKCLDIGVGANCIYPIIGTQEYGWYFVGSDVSKTALESANKIVTSNPSLAGKLELRLQSNSSKIFSGIIQANERFDLTLCNPPFHASKEEANAGTLRKLKNLKQNEANVKLNFGGQSNELWCEGGEIQFIHQMITESKDFVHSCLWFTTLVSKQANLKSIYVKLKTVGALEIKTLPMSQGNKISRIVAWTFLTKTQQTNWMKQSRIIL